ncbi:MAG TPA: c-type cytochrome [Egibacteraceae bacterium]|nr:c-type cytochrome [Egibacteraceae bacterium]
MTTTTIAIGTLALAGVLVLGFLVVNSRRPKRAYEDVPPAMRPGYSDEELEKTVIERYMAWGVVLTLFFAVFFPLYWLNETRRLNTEQRNFFVESVVRGEEDYTQMCAECHGGDAGGGAATAPDDPESVWPAPALNNIVARYEDNPNIDDIEEFIIATIERGRPGTPMPAWGREYDGPLTDEQVENITNWILAQQVDPEEDAEAVAQPTDAPGQSGEDLYQGNCAKCHGADLQGGVGPPLVNVFDRHSEAQILAILRHGIYVPTGAIMPPWQDGYMYPDARYSDSALQRIVDYLREQQADDPDEEQADEVVARAGR